MKSLQKTIDALFGILFFLVPLILLPYTSELFEFNKIIVIYLLTILIAATWIVRMILERKIIFRRTILDIPLLVFLGSQLISTLLSIDPLTSWLGYYSRFNGGLASLICYLLLYWAFVSNVGKKAAGKIINVTLLSASLVSIYGVLERLGIDKSIWFQDVQHRVFSTLGQPNWLAAWLTALIPITWALAIKKHESKLSYRVFIPYLLSTLFFIVLIFTGSRSGIAGFAIAEAFFWGFVVLKYRFKYVKEFLILNAFIAAAIIIFGTQFTPSIFKLVKKAQTDTTPVAAQAGTTALETGGTESGAIRKIVWQGAIQIWKHYPIFGTGVETFAYSYYFYRPPVHNMTSEWDYIYNKAHNEYLNFMANSGTVGILAYLTMVGFAIYLMARNSRVEDKETDDISSLMVTAFVSGYVSILATNFFGFSVVPIQLLFFLYPAFSVIYANPDFSDNEPIKKLSANQKVSIWIVVFAASYLLIMTIRYWYADILYASGSNYNRAGRQDLALPYLNRAIKLEPRQSVFYSELAKSYTSLALAYSEAKQATASAQLTEAAIEASIKSVNLSPANVNLKRIEFGTFIMLSTLDPNYLLDAKDVLFAATVQAPTDAKLSYNLALTYSRLGQNDLAVKTLEKTIELKPNYRDARLAYAMLLIDAGKKSEAKIQLEYILTNIDPTDSMAKQYLESVN